MFPVQQAALASKYVIKTHYIMRVIEFYPETQTVDLIQDVFEYTNAPFGDMTVNNEFGNTVTVTLNNLDVLRGVPVKQLRWGQFEIQCCPKKDDTGYIEVFTNDIQRWVEEGGPSIPWSDDHFIKQNCVFVPFMPNHKNASTDYIANEDGTVDNTRLRIKSANASFTITDKPAENPEDAVVDITTTAKTVNINAENGISLNGDVNVTGNITASGVIKASGDIVAGAGTSGEVSLQGHTHTIETGAPISTSQGPGTITAPINVPAPNPSTTGA